MNINQQVALLMLTVSAQLVLTSHFVITFIVLMALFLCVLLALLIISWLMGTLLASLVTTRHVLQIDILPLLAHLLLIDFVHLVLLFLDVQVLILLVLMEPLLAVLNVQLVMS